MDFFVEVFVEFFVEFLVEFFVEFLCNSQKALDSEKVCAANITSERLTGMKRVGCEAASEQLYCRIILVARAIARVTGIIRNILYYSRVLQLMAIQIEVEIRGYLPSRILRPSLLGLLCPSIPSGQRSEGEAVKGSL